MFLTRISVIVVCIVLFSGLRENNLFCQEIINSDSSEITILDTLEYISIEYEGALENNLMVAASRGLVTEIDRLISLGADIEGESYEGATPLIFAVVNNQLGSVLKLLEYDPVIDKMTKEFETPLIIAAKNNNVEIAEALIRHGTDINLGDNYGAGPLHYACLNGSFYIVDLLLYYEADCNIKTNDGTTPLMAAIWAGNADLTDLLFQSGANLEARDNKGFTPFLIAAQNGDTLIMHLLLNEGVDLYEKNIYDYNALNLAIESNHKTAVEMLLKRGDKWASPENGSINPYIVAFSFGRKDIIGILEENNIKGKGGWKINEVEASASVKFNNRDYYAGLILSFKEPLINAGFKLGLDTKPAYTRVLLKSEDNLYYQYFDRSSIIFAGIFKDFPIAEYKPHLKLLISSSLSTGYNFGTKYKGTSLTPENKIRIMPSAGIKFEIKHIIIKSSLEYMNTDFYRIFPLWFRLSVGYNQILSRTRSPVKSIKWN